MLAVKVSSVHYSYPPGPVILNSREIYYPVIRARGTQIQFPAPPRRLTAICNSSSKGSGALFWLAQALHAGGAQTYRQAKGSDTENKNTYNLVESRLGKALCLPVAGRGPHG